MKRSALLWTLPCLVLAACPGPVALPGELDAGDPPADASAQPPDAGDAGADDAGAGDAGAVDAGEGDAGTVDAGCPGGSVELQCGDGADDDCDGLVDCADADCEAKACADDAQACTVDVCAAGQCTHPPGHAGAVCRASAGGCDAVELCTGASAACPADVFDATCTCPFQGPLSGYAEGDGLRHITPSRFALRDTGTWAASAARLDGLGLTQVGLDALPLNRTAAPMPMKGWPGFQRGFFWDSGDRAVAYWVPQGLAGGSAGARSLVAVAWHYDEVNNATDANPPTDGSDKGVRVSFADVTNPAAGVTYRHVLLVEPDAARGFKPVTNHGGGLAWAGTLLYEADTNRGLRVFDLTRILEVSTAAQCSARAGVSGGVACAYGYRYVLPQVGAYVFPPGLSASCRPAFSFVSIDLASTPPSLVSGEYDNDPALGIYSRVLRWPLSGGSSRLATGASGVVAATEAWYAGNRNLQGGVASGARVLLNSTRWSGALFTGTTGSASTRLRATDGQWGWMPEGMHLGANGELWISTEGHASLDRGVFAVRAADLP